MGESDELEESVTIQAPPEVVWELVGDPANYPRWSPMTVRTLVRGRPVAPGSTMVNLNRLGWRVWPTRAQVTSFEEGHRIAFRVKENRSTWSYTVTPEAAGTRLTIRRDTDEGISGISLASQRMVMGGVASFTNDLREGIVVSLSRIKEEAEA